MIILPAIDILGGQCVRLTKGEYGTASKGAADPYETAKSFEADGATFIHMVDLDGAKAAKPVNTEIFVNAAKTVNIPIELGGGIRDMETVDYYIQNGISRVILGSAALRDPEFVKKAVAKYGEKIAVGIDAKNGFVSADGWLNTSEVGYIEFALLMEKCGVRNIIFTDISRDGTLSGPALGMLGELKNALGSDMLLTASGGIKSIEDIRELKELGVYGAICGKSLYSGTLSLKEAVALCAE